MSETQTVTEPQKAQEVKPEEMTTEARNARAQQELVSIYRLSLARKKLEDYIGGLRAEIKSKKETVGQVEEQLDNILESAFLRQFQPSTSQ